MPTYRHSRWQFCAKISHCCRVTFKNGRDPSRCSFKLLFFVGFRDFIKYPSSSSCIARRDLRQLTTFVWLQLIFLDNSLVDCQPFSLKLRRCQSEPIISSEYRFQVWQTTLEQPAFDICIWAMTTPTPYILSCFSSVLASTKCIAQKVWNVHFFQPETLISKLSQNKIAHTTQ